MVKNNPGRGTECWGASIKEMARETSFIRWCPKEMKERAMWISGVRNPGCRKSESQTHTRKFLENSKDWQKGGTGGKVQEI
jgi:hypothetical protein